MRALKVALLLAVCILAPVRLPVQAQEEQGPSAIDMMVVIDNSCSMFPRELILRGCTSYGSDVDFLRIKGADLFFARLGFAEPNEAEYQVGVVSLGDEPLLVSPLKPVFDTRDALAREVANPQAQSATRIVPALELAYQELRQSPNRKPGNLPTVVLITDGVPWPPEGQSTEDIESLIQANADIPLFLMLLQGSGERSDDYTQYIRFWEQMQTRFDSVFVYTISAPEQIEKTYNAIIAQLQDTIPTKGTPLSAETALQFYVSEYVKKVVVTVVHPSSQSRGLVTIVDPNASIVKEDDPGVSHFSGADNPVEIYSIGAPRLDEYLKQNYWTIRSSQPATIFIDREGSYRINFLSPAANATAISSIYQASEIQNPKQELMLRFSLEGEDGDPIREPQTIQAELVLPDGTQTNLGNIGYIKPDSNGVYDFPIDIASYYPAISDTPGGFTLVLHAGSVEDRASEQVPITSARLLIDAGPVPYIEGMDPAKPVCASGSPSNFNLNIGDYAAALPGSVQARLSNGQSELLLESTSPGVFGGNLDSLCAPLISGLECSSQADAELQLQVDAQLADGTQLPPITRSLPVQVFAPNCTPRPVSTPTLTAREAPTPTPVPDTDQDGWVDPVDACPQVKGWNIFEGCPPPTWFWLLSGGLALGVLSSIATYAWPWVRVRTTAKPPEAYILVCRRGKTLVEPQNIQALGLRHRTQKIKIGGNRRKAHIYVEGLKPLEFVVMPKDEKVILTDAKTGGLKGTFRHLAPDEVATSNPEITIWIGLNLNVLSKIKCQKERIPPESG